jgi:site-specific recombinase XerD
LSPNASRVPVTAGHDSNLELLARFEDSEMMRCYTPGTRLGHLSHLLRFARTLNGSLLDLDEQFVRDWIEDRRSQWSTATDLRYRSALHRFYSWALHESLVERDPAAPLMRIRRPFEAGDFPELARDYRIAMERRGLKPVTTIARRLQIMRRLADQVAPRSLLDVTTGDIEAHLDAARCGPKFRYTTLSHLHMFFKWAVKQGLVEKDPTEDIDRPIVPKGVPRPIGDDDLITAIDQAPTQIAAMLGLAAYAGLRCQEIAAVEREDIRDQLDPPVLIVRNPKGHKQRVLPLHPEAWRLLQSIGLPRSGLIFWRSSYGSTVAPAAPWWVSHVIKAHLHELGIGTAGYRESLDIRLVQDLLGHADPPSTAIYVAFAPGKAVDVVTRLSPQAAKEAKAV